MLIAASAGATDWMPARSLWLFSAFSFSSAAICLSIFAQFGLTALMSRMVIAEAQPARIRIAQDRTNARARIAPLTSSPGLPAFAEAKLGFAQAGPGDPTGCPLSRA
jgi:hypothetical protein